MATNYDTQTPLGDGGDKLPITQEVKDTFVSAMGLEIPAGAQAKATAAQAAAAADATTKANAAQAAAATDATTKANAAQAAAIQRANHTGTQATSTVTGLDAALAARSLIADIRNNLTSNEADKPLSAAQGVVLKAAIDAINVLLSSDETTLDSLQEVVDFIQLNREDLDALSISSIAGLVDALAAKETPAGAQAKADAAQAAAISAASTDATTKADAAQAAAISAASTDATTKANAAQAAAISAAATDATTKANAAQAAAISAAATDATTKANAAEAAAISAAAAAVTDAAVKTKYEANANTNAFTDAEKTKLAGLDDSHFKGTYLSLAALETAHPTATAGDYAHVDAGIGSAVGSYIWDDDDVEWVVQSGESTSETAASIKTKYESNADTNALTDALLSKLNAIEDNADVTDAVNVAAAITGSTEITAIADDEKIGAIDTSTGLLGWFSYTRIRDKLKTYFDTLYNLYSHPDHTGDVTSAGDGATTIAADAVSNTKLANMANATIKGRSTAGTGDPEDLNATQIRAILGLAAAGTTDPLALKGVVDASSAGAGFVGEEIETVVSSGSPIALTTATPSDIASIVLTAGNWLIEGSVNFVAIAATLSGSSPTIGSLNSTSATLTSTGLRTFGGLPAGTYTHILTVPMSSQVVSISAGQTWYLVAQATFSAGTVNAYGFIRATRIR